jgi:hypothetical protein
MTEPTSQKDDSGDEAFPLRKAKVHSEVLLVGFDSLKDIMEQKIGFKCDSSETE